MIDIVIVIELLSICIDIVAAMPRLQPRTGAH